MAMVVVVAGSSHQTSFRLKVQLVRFLGRLNTQISQANRTLIGLRPLLKVELFLKEIIIDRLKEETWQYLFGSIHFLHNQESILKIRRKTT